MAPTHENLIPKGPETTKTSIALKKHRELDMCQDEALGYPEYAMPKDCRVSLGTVLRAIVSAGER